MTQYIPLDYIDTV